MSQTQLANIALEEDHAAESEGLIRTALAEFEKEKLSDNQAVAQALLTLIMLKQGRVDDALRTANRAVSLSRQSGDRQARFNSELANAKALAASGKSADGLNRLQAVLTEARKYGYLNYEYQARLAHRRSRNEGRQSRSRAIPSGRPQPGCHAHRLCSCGTKSRADSRPFLS